MACRSRPMQPNASNPRRRTRFLWHSRASLGLLSLLLVVMSGCRTRLLILPDEALEDASATTSESELSSGHSTDASADGPLDVEPLEDPTSSLDEPEASEEDVDGLPLPKFVAIGAASDAVDGRDTSALPPDLDTPKEVSPPSLAALKQQALMTRTQWERKVSAPHSFALLRDFTKGPLAFARTRAHADDFRATLADGLTLSEFEGAVLARNAKIRRAHMELRRRVDAYCTVSDNALIVDPLTPATDLELDDEYRARPGSLEFQASHTTRRLRAAQAEFAGTVRNELVRAGALFADYTFASQSLSTTTRALASLDELSLIQVKSPFADESSLIEAPTEERDAQEDRARLVSDTERWKRRLGSIRADIAELIDMPLNTSLGTPIEESFRFTGQTASDILQDQAMNEQPDVLAAEFHAAAADLVSSFAGQALPKDGALPLGAQNDPHLALRLIAAQQVAGVAKDKAREAQANWHAVRNRTVIAVAEAVAKVEQARARVKQYGDVALPKASNAAVNAAQQYSTGQINRSAATVAVLQRRTLEEHFHAAQRDLARSIIELEGAVGASLTSR